jgi:hypothetical protein
MLYAGLSADRLHAITDHRVSDARLRRELQHNGVNVASIERTEPMLEDVFLSLAR